MPKYYVNPFALNGDKVPIPDATDPSGFVSYDSGYTFDYERDPDPSVDPLTKDIERDKMNQIFFDLTDNVKFLQDTGGVPEWSAVRAAAGGYPRDAKVSNAGTTYTSTINANASTPGASATWILGGQTDPTIIAIAALTPGANQLIYFTAPDVAATTAITSFGRSLLAANNDVAGRALLNISNATTSNMGLIRQATDAEVNSGADVVAAVNPRQNRLGMTAVLAANGGLRLPSWMFGITFNWGAVSVGNDNNAFVPWSVPYANGGGVWQFFGNFGSSGNNQNSGLIFETTSATQGRIYHNGSSTARTVRWWSVGRSL